VSSSYTTYIGPYLGVPEITKVKKVDKEIQTCTNKDCKNYKTKSKNKFCSECGTATSKIKITEHKSMNMYDIMKELDMDIDTFTYADLSDDEQNLYLYNNVNYFYDEGEPYEKEFDLNEMQTEMKMFKNKTSTKKVVNYLEENSIDYQISYGVVGFYL